MTKEIKRNAIEMRGQADKVKTASVNGEDLNQVLAELATRMGSGAVIPNGEEVLKMNCNDEWLLLVSRRMLDAAYKYDNTVKFELTEELIAVYLKWVMLNRMNYVVNGRNVVHPRDVKYPVLMFDALARIAKYDGTKSNGNTIKIAIKDSEITEMEEAILMKAFPSEYEKMVKRQFPDGREETQEVDSEGNQVAGRKKPLSWVENNRVIDFPGRDSIVSYMSVAGIQIATGLPMEKTTQDRTIYEMDIDEARDIVTTAGMTPSIAQVFARCFYDFTVLSEIVGPQKVELLLCSTLRSALTEIVEKYVQNMRR